MLIIIRIGSELPAPGVDGEVFKQWWASQSADGLGFSMRLQVVLS